MPTGPFGIQTLDLPAVAGAAEQTRGFRNRNEAAQRSFRAQDTLSRVLPGVISGEPGARDEAFDQLSQTGNIDVINGYAQFLSGRDANELEAIKRESIMKASLATKIVDAKGDPERQAALYENAFQMLRSNGIDTGDYPDVWDPSLQKKLEIDMEGWLIQGEMAAGTFGKPFAAQDESGAGMFQVDPATGQSRRVGGGIRPIEKTPLVKIESPGGITEDEEAKKFGGFLVKEFEAISDRSQASQQARANLGIARRLNEESLPTEFGQAAGNVAVALGIPLPERMQKQVTDGQAFVATVNNLVLDKMQQQKGPQTESDMRLIKTTTASLGQTPEAREFVIRASDNISRRDIMQKNFWTAWRKNENTFAGAGAAWDDLMSNTPFVGDDPRTEGAIMFLPEYVDWFLRTPGNEGAGLEDAVKVWNSRYSRLRDQQ